MVYKLPIRAVVNKMPNRPNKASAESVNMTVKRLRMQYQTLPMKPTVATTKALP